MAAFAADAATGRLALIGHVPAPAGPRSFGLSPDGRLLYAAGEAGGELATYRVDGKTGALSETGRCYIGRAPMWVMGAKA
jgi:6-phosphogluconolactonase